jgi:hypothetical protein
MNTHKDKGVKKPFRGKKANLFVEYFFDAMDTWDANSDKWSKGKTYDEVGKLLEDKAKWFAKRLWKMTQ